MSSKFAHSCQWGSWGSCSDTCGGPDTRMRYCECRLISGTNWDQIDCTNGNSQTQNCPNNSAACFYSSPTFIITMFGLSVLIAGAMVLACLKLRAARMARAAQAVDGTGAGSSTYIVSAPPYPGSAVGLGNPAYQCDLPPAYLECVLPPPLSNLPAAPQTAGAPVAGGPASDSAASSGVRSPADSAGLSGCNNTDLPPAYEEAVAQIKRHLAAAASAAGSSASLALLTPLPEEDKPGEDAGAAVSLPAGVACTSSSSSSEGNAVSGDSGGQPQPPPDV